MQTRSSWRAVAVGMVGVLFATMTFAPRALFAQPSLVVLVRHGEKATEGGSDPSLSEAGKARAQALADAMAMTTPNAIIVSSLKRTAETAAVVFSKTGVVPTVIAIGGATHVADVAAAVRKATIAVKLVPVLCGSALRNKGIKPPRQTATTVLTAKAPPTTRPRKGLPFQR
mgnify:CR=1 FL=1